ncbi:dUTP diphosphatase [Candidatus Saccharibacteria bacterium CPR2]|nr:dUTP diphosphatase [Candidatus Saccharibacteria bacterium CPR2]
MKKLQVKIKRFDRTLPLPTKQTSGAACFDLYARVDTKIQPKSVGYIPLNVAIEAPKEHWVLLAARSSLHKRGLLPANGIGIVDEDFSGDGDEFQLIVYNFTDELVTIERNARIAQAMVIPTLDVKIIDAKKLNRPNRGGIGSTGVN